MSDTVPSPCVRNCCLDEDDICIGCGRTLDEIRNWLAAGAERQRAILALAAARRRERERRYAAAQPRER